MTKITNNLDSLEKFLSQLSFCERQTVLETLLAKPKLLPLFIKNVKLKEDASKGIISFVDVLKAEEELITSLED